jgi:sugar phosphate permease
VNHASSLTPRGCAALRAPCSQSVRKAAALRVFLPFACAYFLSYFYRVANAVLSPDLVRDLQLDAGALGLLTSAYFLAFALLQLPVGLLLDRFGPRRVDAALLCVAAAGAALFAAGESVPALVAGRALIGAGVSACLMASIKAFTLWFPLARLATLNGWLMAAGGLGAMAASAPLELALRWTDWRGVFAALAVLTLAAALAVALLVPERTEARAKESLRELAGGFAHIYRDPGFWPLALVSFTVPATSLAVQGLWVAPWLRDVAGLGRDAVASTLLLMAAGTTVGFAAQGPVSEMLARRGVTPLQLLQASAGASVLLLAAFAGGSTFAAPARWVLFSVLAPVASLAYAIQTHRYDAALAGRVNTAVNLLVFLGAFAAQWGVGAIVDLWPAESGRHPAAAYGAAFGALAGAETLALAVLFASGRLAGRTAQQRVAGAGKPEQQRGDGGGG